MTAVHGAARLPSEDERETFVRRNLRRNIGGLGLDFGLFIAGASFATQATVVVAFAAFLGAPTIILGGIPAIQTVGRILPGLLVARHTESLPRKMPMVIWYSVGE